MEKKGVPRVQSWAESLMVPALNQSSQPTEVIVWITAEPGQQHWPFIGFPYHLLDCTSFSKKFTWSSAFLGTKVQGIIKEPPLRIEQCPWRHSGYEGSREHQGLISESKIREWRTLLLPAQPASLLSRQDRSPWRHPLLAGCSCSSSSSSSRHRAVREQIFPPCPATAGPVTIWLMKVLLWSHC